MALSRAATAGMIVAKASFCPIAHTLEQKDF
jgi:hypothetical protein